MQRWRYYFEWFSPLNCLHERCFISKLIIVEMVQLMKLMTVNQLIRFEILKIDQSMVFLFLTISETGDNSNVASFENEKSALLRTVSGWFPLGDIFRSGAKCVFHLLLFFSICCAKKQISLNLSIFALASNFQGVYSQAFEGNHPFFCPRIVLCCALYKDFFFIRF